MRSPDFVLTLLAAACLFLAAIQVPTKQLNLVWLAAFFLVLTLLV